MKTEELSAEKIVSRAQRIAQRMFEERMLVITVNNSKLHRFNEVGTYIWQLLDQPRSIQELCSSVAEHFENSGKNDIKKDVTQFINAIEKKGLVRIG